MSMARLSQDRIGRQRFRVCVNYDPELGLTKQSEKDRCDLKKIWKKHVAGQAIDHLNWNAPKYGDFSLVTDFQGAMNQLNAAEDNFNRLPSHIREDFHNSPHELLAFLDDPANADEAIELGFTGPSLEAQPENPAQPIPEDQTPRAQSPVPAGDLSPPKPTPVAGGE